MEKNKSKKEQVAVLMSGGVDSSVSALLLKKQGFDVSGFFMKLQRCRKSEEAWHEAQKVAKQVGIPIFAVDGKKIFEKEVINYFVDEYNDLRTPNPCVRCNRLIKFGWFFEEAKKRGFEKVATGHYAQVKKDKDGTFHLLSGRDKNKDQSYFLHYLDQAKLSRIIFPVGNLQKIETRKIAKKNKLFVSDKKESQEVCFVPNDDYRAFLKKYSRNKLSKSGKIVSVQGEVLGKHSGLTSYTIGQRKGLGEIRIKNENSRPLFVLGFNEKKNELIVGSEDSLYKKEMFISNPNWVSSKAKEKALAGKSLKVKIRYRHEAVACSIKKTGKKIKVVFRKTQRAVTPGQSAVFYFGKEVAGGGIIVV
jgi:tRNA-specific 2-thiouridylase